MDLPFSYEQIASLSECTICPRNCGVSRFSEKPGYCGVSGTLKISSVCIHRGEEPPISGPEGICNIFFSGCNLRCIFCQNFQISSIKYLKDIPEVSLENVLKKITDLLDRGFTHLGFVSPSHVIPQVKLILKELHTRNYFPVTVYNTNAYDKVNTLRSFEDIIDVYLPDFKYMDRKLAKKLSDAEDYPETAAAAIKEMYRQKGAALHLDEKGRAISGIIIRHLVIPGEIDNSLEVLHYIAEEISPNLHISLMSQYHPSLEVRGKTNLNRTLTTTEYRKVTEEMDKLGLARGWIQELESAGHYLPDFEKMNPFEK